MKARRTIESILEVYRAEGYTDACYIAANAIYDEERRAEYVLRSPFAGRRNADVLRVRSRLSRRKAEREITVSVRAFKYYEEKDGEDGA